MECAAAHQTMALEKYFLYLDGTQRGPYTVSQIHHMVNQGIVSSEAMFWCEGLDQWQPVTQLIVPKEEARRRRFEFRGWMLAVAAVLGFLGWLAWPMIREGWQEQHQVAFTPEAAYWRARGVVRDGLGKFTAVQFDPYQPGDVRLSETGAQVRLGAETKKFGGERRHVRWMVLLRYDGRLNHWQSAPDVDASSEAPASEPNPAPVPPP
jgi:hypothetical protein